MASNHPFPSSNLGHEHNQALKIPGRNAIKSAADLLLSVSICTEENKAKIVSLASTASEELQQMVLEKEPLWLIDEDGSTEVLNNVDYSRRFTSLDATLEEVIRVIKTGWPIELPELNEQHAETPCGSIGSLSGLLGESNFSSADIEASRAVGLVSADPLSLVNTIMDVEHWSSLFSNIVSRASNLGNFSTGGELGSPDGALQVVTAEFHFPSPLFRTREICFARYCRQLDSNTWLVVDVSLESIFPNLRSRFQRRPSGCLIQGLDEGSSKVTWVENNAVNDRPVQRISSAAFGAKRWIATLERQCDRYSSLEKQPDKIALPKKRKGLEDGKNSVLKLAERMVRSFSANVSSYLENSWRKLPINGAEEILVKTISNLDYSGAPRGVAVTIATSIRLQKPQMDVFNFLCDVHKRDEWDILSCGRVIREIEHISYGRDNANQISILLSVPAAKKKTKRKNAKKKNEMLYLQETFSDSTGLYVVYSPIDRAAVRHILDGKDPENVSILPSGFAVLPDSDAEENENSGGSILTIAFEIMDENVSTPEHLPSQSVSTAHSIIRTTVDLINTAILPSEN